jgi:hypothetical protein
VTELRVVLLEHDALRIERSHQLVDVVLRRGHRDRREAERRVDWDIGAVHASRERELVLERGPERESALGEPALHSLQERALADRSRLPVEVHVVGEHGAGARRVWQHTERPAVGQESDLADGPHLRDRLQLVEAAHRLHRDGQADAGPQPVFQPVPRRRLRADRAVVSAPEEPHEAQIGLINLGADLLGGHAATITVPLLYLDQNYLSGIAKRKPAFRELEPALRDAVARGAVAVVESVVHERESRPRPDLKLVDLLRELTGGRRLPSEPDARSLEVRRRLVWTIEHDLPQRRARHSDAADLDALAIALRECDLVTCDAFMADVVRRARLDLRHGCELFTGRRDDVRRLCELLGELAQVHAVGDRDERAAPRHGK